MRRKDLDEIIEALTLSVVRNETDEQFFRRSAEKTDAGEARALYLGIAGDLKRYRESLEKKKASFVARKEQPVKEKPWEDL